MESQIYYIRIKKEYAAALIEDLQQADAIEILEELLPEMQEEEAAKRLAKIKATPSTKLSEDQFLKALDEDE